MKQIIAYIKPHKLEKVMLALHQIEGLTGISVLEMQGCGRSSKSAVNSIFDEDNYNLVSRIKLEIACDEQKIKVVMDAIQKNAHTGLKGDGKIYLLPILEAVRISTGETGEMAI